MNSNAKEKRKRGDGMALLNEDRKRMVEDHLYLVKPVVLGTIDLNESVQGLGFDDLYQTGCEALCHAALQYDPDRGASFATFAKVVLHNQLISHCRKAVSHQWETEYLDAPIKDGDGLTYADTLTDLCDHAFSDVDILSVLVDAEGRYSGICKKGIHALILKCQGHTGTEIAADYGVKPKYVASWISRAKNRLRADGSLACFM